MVITWEDALEEREVKGVAKGEAIGEARGALQATRDAIVLLARSFHKEIPEGFKDGLNAIDSLGRLHEILEQIPRVRSLEEIDVEPTQ